jgi:hypothetical protein
MPADDDPDRFFVGLHVEVGSSAFSFAEAHTELFLVGLGLGLNREGNDRLREVHRLEDDGFFSSQPCRRRDGLQPDRRGDVARVDFLDVLALVRVHLEQAADALGLLLPAL